MKAVMPDAGYWIEANVVSARECDDIIEAVSQNMMSRGRAGARHLMNNPTVKTVATGPRLLQIARRALGEGAVPFRATLFEKSDRANWLVVWHQDTALPVESRVESPDWVSWSRKAGVLCAHALAWALSRVLALRIHLDAATSENGQLRVIPGSHAAGVLTDEEVFTIARTQEAVECLVPRGGVMAMRPLLIHSSSKARTAAPRRVLHVEYADSLQLDSDVRLAIA